MPDHIVIGDIRPRIQFTADGIQTEFTYPFPIFAAADLKVYLGEALQAGGYAASGAGQSAGGSIAFAVAPLAGTIVTLLRALAIARTSDFQEGGAFRAKTLNDELDRQTAFVQEAAERIERALVAAPTESAAPLVLPPPAQRANALLGFDAAGAPLAVAGPAGTAPVSTAMAPVVQAATLSLGRAAFGLAAGATAAKAAQPTAEGGADDADYMTALRTYQAIQVLACPAAALVPGGRLAFDSGVPVPLSDKLAQTALRWVPKHHAMTKLWDGSAWRAWTLGEAVLPLDADSGHAGYHQGARNFDVFAALGGGAPVLGTGPAWTGDTARGAGATELEYRDGALVNKAAIALRTGAASGDTIAVDAGKALYLGTVRTTADGQTEWTPNPAPAPGGSNNKLFLWNAYHRVPVTAVQKDSNVSHTYTINTTREFSNSLNTRISFVGGLAEGHFLAIFNALSVNSSANIGRVASIGYDAIAENAPKNDASSGANSISGSTHILARGCEHGFHFLQETQRSAPSGTATWYDEASQLFLYIEA